MNIVFFVPIIDQIGGAELATWRLCERLAQRGHHVTILSTQAMSRWRRHQSIFDYTKGIRLIRLPVWQRSKSIFVRMLTAQALWAFPLLLRETQIIHLRGLTPESMMLAQIARRIGIVTLCVPMASGTYGDVATFPANYPKNPTVFDWISALTEPLCTEVVVWGFPANKISIIPNGVDKNFFRPPEHPVDVPRVISVGQFRAEKRIDLLLRAWVEVHKAHPQARLTLVGGGQNTKSYTRMADQLSISPTFIPNIDTTSVLAHLQASCIFVMSGISEGMSNALLEAMAVGLASIVADTPANRAVITPETNGLSYPSDSSEALATQIIRLIADSALRCRTGASARKTILERFDLESVTEQYLALYAQLLGEKL